MDKQGHEGGRAGSYYEYVFLLLDSAGWDRVVLAIRVLQKTE